nr:protoporphyrinogen oxidase [Hymenolepis microstoma]
MKYNVLNGKANLNEKIIKMARCIVVGGGISGLSTAYLLSRLPRTQVGHVSLFEANSSHLGGCILTHRNSETGALHDLGPHSARIASAASNPLLRLVSSLGFSKDEVFWMPSLTRYLYAAGALRPLNLLSPLSEPPFTRSHLSMFIRRALTKGPGPIKEDISVDEFLRSRFDDEFADYLGTALMRGICGADSKTISASAFLGHMIKWEQESPNLVLGAVKSIITGKVQSLYPTKTYDVPHDTLDKLLPPLRKDIVPPKLANVLNFSAGMQALTDRIVDELNKMDNVDINMGSTVCSLDYKDNAYELEIEQLNLFRTVDADAVFICTPVKHMKTLLSSRSFISSNVTKLLSAEIFPSASIAVVALEFDIPKPKLPRGFGHLLPLCEDETVMGVIYDSCCSPLMDGKIASRKTTRFTVMLSPRKKWLEATEGKTSFSLEPTLRNELIAFAMNALKIQLGLTVNKPIFAHAGFWCNTIPTYPVGHLENKNKIRKSIQDRLGWKRTLHLVGYALDGVGVGDCVKSAVNAVDSFSSAKGSISIHLQNRPDFKGDGSHMCPDWSTWDSFSVRKIRFCS